jgi:hypothetical protein
VTRRSVLRSYQDRLSSSVAALSWTIRLPDKSFGSASPRFSRYSWISPSVATIRRAELAEDKTSMTAANDLAVRRAFEAVGVEFIDGSGGGPGVRLRKARQHGKRK